MSRFAGWVQMPRLPLEQVLDDEITGFEHYVFMVLMLLADAGTGSGRINAPLLCYYTGQVFSHDTAQRILASLHAKKRIWYRARCHSKKGQPYWINGYVITRGIYKLRQIDLSQLYDKEAICEDDVWVRAVQPSDDSGDHRSDEDRHNYKKGNKTLETDNSITVHSRDEAQAASFATSRTEAEASSQVERHAEACAEVEAEVCCSRTLTETVVQWSWGDEIDGYRFRCGEDAGYYSVANGRRISWAEAQRLAEKGGTTNEIA